MKMYSYGGSVNWNKVSYSGNLSDEFIIENANKLNWNILVRYQKLSKKIIYLYRHKMNKFDIDKYQDHVKLTDEFKIEMQMRGYL